MGADPGAFRMDALDMRGKKVLATQTPATGNSGSDPDQIFRLHPGIESECLSARLRILPTVNRMLPPGRNLSITSLLIILISVQAGSALVADNPGYQPGSIIICFTPETMHDLQHMDAVAGELHAGIGSVVLGNASGIGLPGCQLIGLLPSVTIPEAIGYYSRNSSILWAEPNYVIRIPGPVQEQGLLEPGKSGRQDLAIEETFTSSRIVPADPYYNLQWGLEQIQAPEAWGITTGSPDVIIAVLDTGIDFSNPEFTGRIWVNSEEIPGNGIDDDQNGYIDDLNGWDFVNNDNSPADDHGHGTAVSSIIGARGNNGLGLSGVMWDVKIMPLKYLDRNGVGYVFDRLEAIQYAKSKGAKIINIASGGSYEKSYSEQAVFSGASEQLFACAAGNDGGNNDLQPVYPASYSNFNVISVAASDENDNLAGFSNYGIETVDAGAPGVNIIFFGLDSKLYTSIGTSYAVPLASGLAGLIASKNPALTPVEIKSIIMNSVDVSGLHGYVKSSGRINAYKALQATPDPEQPAPGQYELLLSPGWNFISAPGTLAEGRNTTAIVFSGVNTAGHSTYLYNASSGNWQKMAGSTEVRPLDGIWLFSDSTKQLIMNFTSNSSAAPTKHLSPGWNAIGFSNTTPAPAKSTLDSVKSQWSTVIGFNASVQFYETSIINGGLGSHSDTSLMYPGKGYWLYANGPGTLVGV